MKLTKETLSVMKNFAAINPSLRLTPGNFIMTKSVNGVAYAEATIADEIDSELNIYDLPNFLSILGQLGEGSDINLSNGEIVIQNGRAKVNLPDAESSVIVVPKQRLRMPPADVEFDLKAEDLAEILKISRAVGADRIAITNRNDHIVIDAFAVEDGDNARTRYSLTVCPYEGTNNFSFVINLENVSVVVADYKINISSKGAAQFQGINTAYVFVLETSSKHDF
ncbi:sliding clamp protein [Aeromonas phage Aes508]|uniref:Sliding clamp n=3 Tax=Tulanevirus TaxID=2560244 RepID=A0A2S1PE32_9CAUD|nr:DNA polymerase processivity factor [Aeromonas phage Aes508]YP_009613134.1 DNA polymerase processivity factor [Aeromonas phage AS-gz]YP_010095556.1 DNA polymerase processivity factor [Aeromonas phage 50AhydR13PP]AFQ97124.1 sliding clamp protein [Aeromonas phage Aes508]ASU00683.1 sliding clamp protein [Aeromonas phage AS-gz]AWH14820.1 sliding clamp protein [Aeromonas phage 50AhydR13PP]